MPIIIFGGAIMPGMNGTGPEGMGPQTGRGMGNCSSGVNVNDNQIPRRGMGQRFGCGRGRGGRGRGRGFGMGQGRGLGMRQGFGQSLQNTNQNQQIDKVEHESSVIEENDPVDKNEIVKK